MKTNPFNICPTCSHRETCVLTDVKNQVWSCSDYEEVTADVVSIPQNTSKENTECQPEMAMV